MSGTRLGRTIRSLLRCGVLLLFAAYFLLVALKSPFDFFDPEYQGPSAGPAMAQVVVENEPSGHLRTGAACLLLGLLIGSASKIRGSKERAWLAFATLAASAILIASTFLGTSPLATQPILLLIAMYGVCISIPALRTSFK